MNNQRDWSIARDRHWYRIPVTSVKQSVKRCWPPDWLAFYQTKVFGAEAYRVQYYAPVLGTRVVARSQLFPGEPVNAKTQKTYYQVLIGPLQVLPAPILSRRWRRINFIPTVGEKFIQAMEINDLYHESPLEDRLWVELKRRHIQAERQEFVIVNKHPYALDFAIYCQRGKIDVETDGDTWHANPHQAEKDRLRDNALTTQGWRVLRFGTQQVQEQAGEYCVKTIAANIEQLGGMQTSLP
ncbi:endonuclease domain-containing protein [Trichothermofontia sp.]